MPPFHSFQAHLSPIASLNPDRYIKPKKMHSVTHFYSVQYSDDRYARPRCPVFRSFVHLPIPRPLLVSFTCWLPGLLSHGLRIMVVMDGRFVMRRDLHTVCACWASRTRWVSHYNAFSIESRIAWVNSWLVASPPMSRVRVFLNGCQHTIKQRI